MRGVARATVLVIVLLSATVVHAQNRRTQDPLQRARSALRAYDLEDRSTIDVVGALTALLTERPSEQRAREARFLRAVASADLWLLRAHADEAMRARLAAAWGVADDALLAAIRRELAALRVGLYRETADDALEALAASDELVVPSEHASHTRRQIVFLTRLRDRLAGGDAVAILAPLADDPCPSECEPPYAHFGPEGRRAIAAMTRVLALVASVERVSQLGDPLSAAFARGGLPFRRVTLAPRDWAANVAGAELDAGRPVDADAAVVIGAQRVRLGWVPEVRWDTDRRPALVAPGTAVLGTDSEARVLVRPDLAPSAVFDALARAVEAHVAGARRLAVIVEPGTEARVLSSVLRTLQESSVQPVTLAVASAGTARGAPIERVTIAGPEPDDAIGLFVRPGGLTVRRRGATTSLPRLRVDGQWQFDLRGLAGLTRDASEPRVMLRYMATADASIVARTAIVAAGTERALSIVP